MALQLNNILIRLFDIVISIASLCLLFPLFFIISFLILIDTKGPVFFKQLRVGINNQDFALFKFRSMYVKKDNDNKSLLLTVGKNDSRITKTGKFLRKYKIDELPQFLNVLKGEMSIVGPRPEVRKYVELYTDEQKKVLSVKPGITDIASIYYFNENELLSTSNEPEELYISQIMPAKIELNMRFIENKTLIHYFKIIFQTFSKILTNR